MLKYIPVIKSSLVLGITDPVYCFIHDSWLSKGYLILIQLILLCDFLRFYETIVFIFFSIAFLCLCFSISNMADTSGKLLFKRFVLLFNFN